MKKNDFGKTALMTAAQVNNLQVVNLLLQNHADVKTASLDPSEIKGNSSNKESIYSGCGFFAIHSGKRTALMYAASNASLAIIQALLAAGANPADMDSNGVTAQDYLTGNGPVPANPIIKGDDLKTAIKLLEIPEKTKPDPEK